MLQEPEVIQENVEGCSLDVFARFLPLYHIDRHVDEPCNYGWPVARPRQYLKMRHKVKILDQISPVSTFCKRFWRAVSFSWHEIMWFHESRLWNKGVIDQEIDKELDWAQCRPNSKAHGQAPLVYGNERELFLAALTESETIQWEAYKARWPGCAGQLNQDAMSPHATHSTEWCLHTLIANCGLIMSDKVCPQRWLLASECLLAQGFPILEGCFGGATLFGSIGKGHDCFFVV